jgi:hypothetical protein
MLSLAELGLGDLAAARQHGLKALRMGVELHTLDWAAFCIVALASVLAAEGQSERAAEYLSFVNEYPSSQYFMRELAVQALDKIRPKLSPEVYTAAVERGKTRQFEHVAAELLAE